MTVSIIIFSLRPPDISLYVLQAMHHVVGLDGVAARVLNQVSAFGAFVSKTTLMLSFSFCF